IGLMITKALVANGAKVYIASRRLELIESVATKLTKIGPALLAVTNQDKYIDSDMSADLDADGPEYLKGIPRGRMGNETDMGGLALFLCSKASAYINGSTIAIDGGTILWM
ncbi:hypothetical protein K7432_017585, partial [Basidiobolus ranarum]